MFDRVVVSFLLAFVLLLFWVVPMDKVEPIDSNSKVINNIVTDIPDFNQYQDINQKKQAFVSYMLPLIQQANAKIAEQRAGLLNLKPTALSSSDKALLHQLAEQYQQPKAPNQSIKGWQQALLKKVDTIPPSLALAQAANESAWGTSRFTTQGFNFFGQWCFTDGCGLVPLARENGKTHEVQVFKTPLASVQAYMLNLNAFYRYEFLRQQRFQLRQAQQPILGLDLVAGLRDYSERREAYVEEIRNMIEFNQWSQYDLYEVQNAN